MADRTHQLVGLQGRHAVLGDQDAAGVHAPLAVGVEFPAEQHGARADRIGRIDDDHVEFLVRLGHELGAVADDQARARIVVGTVADRGQPLDRGVDDALVQFHLDGRLDGMLQHLAQDAAVAAPDHEDALGVPVGEQRHVRHHLVIDELVALGRLRDAVERHDPAEGRVRVDHEILEVGSAPVQDLTDLVGHGDVLVEFLAEPRAAAQSTRPRLCSITLMLSGPNASRRTGMPL
jgi:hypothetical protein